MKYVSLCIWGDGPGRPFDNGYIVKDVKVDKEQIRLLFDGGEECVIMSPEGIIVTNQRIIIAKAQKVIWKFYYYGKPQKPETMVTINYTTINDARVCVDETGALESNRNITINGKNALELIGDLSHFFK